MEKEIVTNISSDKQERTINSNFFKTINQTDNKSEAAQCS